MMAEEEASRVGEVTLLEFRAGKMIMEGTRVLPDRRKGLVRIGRGEEGLVHFQWVNREHNVVEDDQIVFPEEAVFEKVPQASGRVYILKFNTDDRKFFFWMQEPKEENDCGLADTVNFFLNKPNGFLDDPGVSIPLENVEDMADEDISSRAGNLVGPSMGAEVSSDVTSSGPVKLSDLQRILSNIGSAGELEDPDAGFGLGDILKPELLYPLVETLPVGQLVSFLPEGQWTPEELMDLLQSPPFRQQVDSFTYVLRTGQIDLAQFGIDPHKCKHEYLKSVDLWVSSTLNKYLLQVQCLTGSNRLDVFRKLVGLMLYQLILTNLSLNYKLMIRSIVINKHRMKGNQFLAHMS